jgi:regulator of sirC expression with transglutaminase-like and TPR domain
MDLDATLQRLAVNPTEPVDLAELALHLAVDEYPALDVAVYLSRIAALADAVRPAIAAAQGLTAQVTVLADALFRQWQFQGNTDDYYDPRNSYLNDVLDRRLGLPITLSILAGAVGNRCGLTIAGVGLPGHFIAKATDASGQNVLFDPYHGGAILDRSSCEALIETITGRPWRLTESALTATPAGGVAIRLLTNLKGAYLREPDYPRAARVIGRLLQLTPGDLPQRRDYGVTLLHAGQPGLAIDHLQAYLTARPNAQDAGAVRAFLKDARRDIARWN